MTTMDLWTQAHRAITIETPLGENALLIAQLVGKEQLSSPFWFQAELRSHNGKLNPNDIIGQPVVVTAQMPSGGKRYFHGLVLKFEQRDWDGYFHHYYAEFVSWFALLSYTTDHRIYQQQTVVQIFEAIVKAYPFADYELRLQGKSYPVRDYCVQYGESDFDFLSRLLAEEGIYYTFEHFADKHVMVLCDGAHAHRTAPGYETVPYFPQAKQARERDHLRRWQLNQQLRSGAYVCTDYDFTAPRKPLLANALIARAHAQAEFEVFEWTGESANKSRDETARLAQLRMESLACHHQVWSGGGNAADLRCGARFTLSQYPAPRNDFNQEYLLIEVQHGVTNNALAMSEGGTGDIKEPYLCEVKAIPFKTPFRPPPGLRKPRVYGAQSAVVVGPTGEEIYTDEHGRVKVQFHWDRYGQRDEKSSCWIRVSSEWAGARFGFIALPRIGQEVIVSFLEGDPDQPLITGRVYNGDNRAPFDLPANKTQSGILTRSTPAGRYQHANALRFEDKKGEEQFYLHAERNMDCVVEADDSQQVGGNRSIEVKGAHHEAVHREIEIESKEGNVFIKAATSITLQVGSSTLSMDKDGNISLNGVLINTTASDQQVIKGGKVFINP